MIPSALNGSMVALPSVERWADSTGLLVDPALPPVFASFAGKNRAPCGEVAVDAPIARCVGLSQSVAGYVAADAEMIELRTVCSRAGLDIAQALSPSPCTDIGRDKRSA